MRVALTGATGFIGSHVLAELQENGHEVTALVRDGTRLMLIEWESFGLGDPAIEVARAAGFRSHAGMVIPVADAASFADHGSRAGLQHEPGRFDMVAAHAAGME